MIFFACTEGADDVVPEIKLETSSVDFTEEGGSSTINFTSADSWTAEVINNSTDTWCSVSPTSGSAGNVKITITATVNDTADDRTAAVYIKSGTISSKISVTQGASINKIPDNQIWYTNGSATEATTPDAPDVFGANIVSNKFDIDKGYWVITFDDSVTMIGDGAFACCENLTSVTIPNSVTSIGMLAFFGCTSLISVTIPDSVTSIGNSAFECCYSLTSFYGKFASSDNRCLIIDGVLKSFAPALLTRYTIPDSVTKIGAYAFGHCEMLSEVTIPNSVTEIKFGAFWGCSNLNGVTIPNSVTEIGDYAFVDCRSLTRMTIPNGVTSIGDSAFCGCTSLTSVTISDSVTSIGEMAFRDCESLTSVYCKPITPPTGGSSMFDYNASNRRIYVPTTSVDAYRLANYWSDYASVILGYNF